LSKNIKIILADAQYLSSMGLRYLLSQKEDLTVESVVSNKTDLFASIEEGFPDLIIIDYDQPNSFYIEDIPAIFEKYPTINLLIISADQNEGNIRQTINFGIKGFLTKKCREDELHNAIQTIMNGGRFFCESVVDILMEKGNVEKSGFSKTFETLTEREREIILLVAEGLTTKQIAEKLFLSPHTVSTHRKNSLKKLEINSVSELIRMVLQEDLKNN